MGRVLVALAALAVLAGVLANCSAPPPGQQREAWRDHAEAACLRSGRVRPSAHVRPMRAIHGNRGCGARRPFQVTAAMGGRVQLTQPAILGCPMIPAVDAWLAAEVQPAAMALFGEPVTAVDIMGSYNCRTRNNRRGAKMSEHAFANALDVSAFRLRSGRRVTVQHSWNGPLDEAVFLRTVHRGACRRFRTVIGPDGDRHHQDHFHLDLAWHGKDDVYCR